MTEDPRIIGEFRDYDGLTALLRQWIAQLGTKYEHVERLAGIPIGYLGRLIQPVPIKGLNRHSMGPVLGALGLKGVLVVDEELLARIRHRLEANNWGARRNSSESVAAVKRKPKRAKLRQKLSQHLHKGDSDWGRSMALRNLAIHGPKFVARAGRIGAKRRWARERVKSALERKAAKVKSDE